MRPLLATLAAGIALALPAPAFAASAGHTSPPAPSVGAASDGTAGYAYLGDGLLLATGTLEDGLGAPAQVAPDDELRPPSERPHPFWVVAEPGGGVRAVWLARVTDFTRPDFDVEFQVRSRRPGGPVEAVSPPLKARIDVDVSSTPNGNVLVVWNGGGAFAAAGGAFAPVTGRVPATRPQAALAPSGAALVAGQDCLDGKCPVTVREAAHATDLGPAVDLPGSENLRGLDAALASDGSALLVAGRTDAFEGSTDTGPSFGPVVAYQRRGNRPFAGPAEILQSMVGNARAGVANGGRGVATFVNGGAMLSIFDLPGDGSAPSHTTFLDVHLQPPPISILDDGSAVVGIGQKGVLQRGPEGPFELRPPRMSDTLNAVALSEAGSLAGWSVRDTPFTVVRPRYRVSIDGGPEREFPVSEPPRRAEEYPGVSLSGTSAGLSVPASSVRVRGGKALIPFACTSPDYIVTGRHWCAGSFKTAGVKRVYFRMPMGAGRYVRVPVGPRRRELVLRNIRSSEDPNGRIAGVILRVRRGEDRRRCGVPEWARTIARAGTRRLLELTRRGPGGSAVTEILMCSRSATQRVLKLAPNATRSVYPVALRGRWAAVVERHIQQGRTELALHRVDTRSGQARTTTLDSDLGLLSQSPRPLRLLLTGSGATALTEGIEGRVRVRAVDAVGDRILDAGPGVDPGSLAPAGAGVSWTRAGTRQTAELR